MPMIMHSFFKPAYSRKEAEIFILPALSTSTDWAGEIILRLNIRARDWKSDVESIKFVEIRLHSSGVKSHKHLSTLCVRTNELPPMSDRIFDGIKMRPFSSSEALNSPVVTLYTTFILFSPLFTTSIHSMGPGYIVNRDFSQF